MTKKKRGRKPKNNIIVNDNPKFDNDQNSKDNLILHIKNKSFDYTDNLVDNLDHNLVDNLDDNLVDNLDHNLDGNSLIYENLSEKICNNCKNKIEESIYYLPTKYENNIFYLNKFFCCKKCIVQYIFSDIKYNTYELYSLYLLYNSMIKNNKKFNIKYIINNKKININENHNDTNNLKLFRSKKENNILKFINNI